MARVWFTPNPLFIPAIHITLAPLHNRSPAAERSLTLRPSLAAARTAPRTYSRPRSARTRGRARKKPLPGFCVTVSVWVVFFSLSYHLVSYLCNVHLVPVLFEVPIRPFLCSFELTFPAFSPPTFWYNCAPHPVSHFHTSLCSLLYVRATIMAFLLCRVDRESYRCEEFTFYVDLCGG